MIAAYYYICYMTIEAFSLSLQPKTKLRGILEIITAAAEFDDIPIRHHEDIVLGKLFESLPVKVENPDFNDPHLKANLLIQAHFSRMKLSVELERDQKSILSRVIRLLQACVDVISSNGWLTPALSAMELSQMAVQALWDRDSPLMQIPHMDSAILKALELADVKHIFDLSEMDGDKRLKILNMDEERLGAVAAFVNAYPSVDVEFKAPEDVDSGQAFSVHVSLESEAELNVIAPHYPFPKEVGWWLVIGDTSKNLHAIKRVQFANQHELDLTLTLEQPGKHDLVLYLMCDTYMGVDQEFEFSVRCK